MGRVDQGVFTFWLLHHHFGRPLAYIGYGGTGKQVRDLLHVDGPGRAGRLAAADPEAWDGFVGNVGGGRDVSLSLRETTELCRELTGQRGRRSGPSSTTGPATCRSTSPTARGCFARTDWRPRAQRSRRARRHRTPGSGERGRRGRGRSGCDMKLSVVIPAHNEAGSIAATLRATAAALERAEIEHEILVVDDASSDGTPAVVDAVADRAPAIRCIASHNPRGFGFAVRAGLERFEGDAVAIVMADGSDDPADLVRYHACSRPATTARSARASWPRVGPRLPAGEAGDQPARELVRPGPLPPRLQRHDERLQGLPPRGDRDRPAAALAPLQPHRRAAAEGDRPRPQLQGDPDHLAQPHLGRRASSRSRRWAAATCSSSSTSFSSIT